jgi:hypothetical protein
MNHYQDGEKSWADLLEKVCKFFCKHVWAFFFAGALLGIILKPAIIGLVFLFWLLLIAWSI